MEIATKGDLQRVEDKIDNLTNILSGEGNGVEYPVKSREIAKLLGMKYRTFITSWKELKADGCPINKTGKSIEGYASEITNWNKSYFRPE